MCLARATSTTELLPELLSSNIQLLRKEIDYEQIDGERGGVTNNGKYVSQKGTT